MDHAVKAARFIAAHPAYTLVWLFENRTGSFLAVVAALSALALFLAH